MRRSGACRAVVGARACRRHHRQGLVRQHAAASTTPPDHQPSRATRGKKRPEYLVPQEWRDAFEEHNRRGFRRVRAGDPLYDKLAGVIDGPLRPENHQAWFTRLQDLEELEEEIETSTRKLSGVKLDFTYEIPSVQVPDVLDDRPLLKVGDMAVCTIAQHHTSGSIPDSHLDVGDYDQGDLGAGYGAEAGLPAKVKKYTAFVEYIEDGWVGLRFIDRNVDPWAELQGRAVDVQFGLNRMSHQVCKDGVAHAARLPEYLLFPKEGDLPTEVGNPPQLELFNKKLENNARQLQAVQAVVLAMERKTVPYIIYGPPGTGKTVTLVESILQVLQKYPEAKVLVCAPANAAVILLAERLLERLDDPQTLVRIKASSITESKVPREVMERTIELNQETLDDVKEARVVCATLGMGGRFGVHTVPKDHFAAIFVDEAGQATEPETLGALATLLKEESKGGPLSAQVVLSGDPKQLGPVIRSIFAKQPFYSPEGGSREDELLGLGTSPLERLSELPLYQRDAQGGYNPLVLTQLVQNYRNHRDILHLPNLMFYDSQLRTADNADVVKNAQSMENWQWLPAPKRPFMFVGVEGTEGRDDGYSYFNRDEAQKVQLYISRLLNDESIKTRPHEIGVVSPYKAQTLQLQRALESQGLQDITVGSVENFQGQERKVIIATMVRSNSDRYSTGNARRDLGFLLEPKRFNVLITRAQALLIVIGNPHTLCQDICWEAYLRYCIDGGCYVGCRPPEQFGASRLQSSAQ